MCGVEASGVDTVGTVYTDGSSDTSALGKALVATAAVAAVVVVAAAAANTSGANNYKPPSCSCPYDTASDGSRCGARSAWSRKGGAAPVCDFTLLTYEDYKEKQ